MGGVPLLPAMLQDGRPQIRVLLFVPEANTGQVANSQSALHTVVSLRGQYQGKMQGPVSKFNYSNLKSGKMGALLRV